MKVLLEESKKWGEPTALKRRGERRRAMIQPKFHLLQWGRYKHTLNSRIQMNETHKHLTLAGSCPKPGQQVQSCTTLLYGILHYMYIFTPIFNLFCFQKLTTILNILSSELVTDSFPTHLSYCKFNLQILSHPMELFRVVSTWQL